MKKTTVKAKSFLCRICVAIGVTALLSGIPNAANATQTVRELWDAANGFNTSLVGKPGAPSSVGFDTSTNWAVSPVGNTSIRMDGWNQDWTIGGVNYDGSFLPAYINGNGSFAYYGADGNMTTTLTNPATLLPYGNYYSQCYATRALNTNAYIDFQANGTYYFSVRVFRDISWWSGDNSGGIGFASSGAPNAHFAGLGWTRLSPFYAADGVTDIGGTVYVTAGTLDQAGVASHPDDSGGVYYPSVAGAQGLFSTGGGVVVGRLTTTTGGSSTINVKFYAGALDTDPNSIVWDATYSFTETNVMKNLLVWAHGTGPALQDALRVGTSYGDVIGLETFGAPTASPGSTVYAGTDVTLGANAGMNSGPLPMSFQWRSNSVDILDATNSTLVLTEPTTAFTADYSVVVNNYYGTLTNVLHVTVNPAVPPFIVTQPVSITRYAGAPSGSFKVVVDGTPPFTYQWKHAGTNFQAPTITATANNTLVFGPVSAADAGEFSVMITNLFGSTNSVTVTNKVIVPSPGSYASVLLSNSPYGYWRMDDNATTSNPTIYDNWGNHNGQVNTNDLATNPNNIIFGVAGAPDVGFPSPHLATLLGNEFWTAPYRLNLPQLPAGYSNTMTFTMWVNGGGDSGGCELMARAGYGNAYGLENNNGNLQFDWGGGIAWDSGLVVPANTWTFVALVVEPTQATIYMGTNKASLASASTTFGLPLFSSTEIGDSPTSLSPLAVSRNPWPWADDGNGSQWASKHGTWSDIAVFYQSLTQQQIQNLYLAGVGLNIVGTPDGSGNLILNWLSGSGAILQQASNVDGPYTDIGAATPPYSVPISPTGNKFYRLKK